MKPSRLTGPRPRALPALLLLTLAGCATNPVTGRRQLALISESQEIQLGQQAAAEAAQSLGLVENQALQSYVQQIGAELAAASERPNLPWTFRVVDDPTPNAFALPGGYIFVTRGLLSLMESEAELATVLGHEIGHVTARHSVSQLSRAQLAQLGLGLGSIFFPGAAQSLGSLASGGFQLLFLRYGRDAERQADELGFRYALQRGYDVSEMDDVFRVLQRVGEKEGRSGLPSWLATHPAPEERVTSAEARIQALPAGQTLRQDRDEYLGQIDHLVYGENPRQGFFQEGRFLHPDLRFQMQIPSDWRTRNTPQAVLAASPRQDAMIRLTLAEGGAQEAARRFLQQQGLQSGRVVQASAHGIPRISGYFQAQTQQGVVTGIASFLEYGGRTYQLLTFTPASRFAAYERLFLGVAESFQPLTDPRVLGIEPQRLDIVRPERAMSLAEFARRHPSTVSLAELALLNQLESEGGTLPAGQGAKRVVRQP